MCPSIADSFELTISEKPLEIQEMIIREEMPIVRPKILRIVENEINPKPWRDRRFRIAIRVVSLIISPDEVQEIK